MYWDDNFDDKTIEWQTDKYGNKYHRNSRLAWASKDKHNRPRLIDGVVLGFNASPSFIYTWLQTDNNRIVKKLNSELIFIYDEEN